MNETLTQPNELALQVQNSGLEQEAQQSLLNAFSSFFEQAKDWAKKADELIITDASQLKEMAQAREARLALKNIRVAAEKTRKSLKEESLRKGKAIDGIYNVIDFLIVPTEKKLEEKERFIEIQELNRKEALKLERSEKLIPFDVQPDFYNLGSMPEDVFSNLLENSKLAFEQKKVNALKEESDRIAKEKQEADERERIRLENEKLKAQAEKREKEFAAERAKIQADNKAKEDAAKRNEARLIEAQKAERQAKEKAESDLKAKEAAELKAEQDKQAAIEAELSMGDKDKYNSLIKEMEVLCSKYTFKSKKYKAAYASIQELLNKTVNYAISKQ